MVFQVLGDRQGCCGKNNTGLVYLKTWLPAVVLVGGRFDCVREDQVPYEMVAV